MHTHSTRYAFHTGKSPEHRLIRMGGGSEAADDASNAANTKNAAEIRNKTNALLGMTGVNNDAKAAVTERIQELQKKANRDAAPLATDPLAQQQEEGSDDQSPLPAQAEASEGDQDLSPERGGNQSPLPVQTEEPGTETNPPSPAPTVQQQAPAPSPTPTPEANTPAVLKTAEQQRQEADQALIKSLSPNMRDLVNRLPAFMRGYAASVISAFAGLGRQPLTGPAAGPETTRKRIDQIVRGFNSRPAIRADQIAPILEVLASPAIRTQADAKTKAAVEQNVKLEELDATAKEVRLNQLNEASVKNADETTQAVEAFYNQPTQANYGTAGFALVAEYEHLEVMVYSLANLNLLEGDALEAAAREVRVRLTMIESLVESTDKMWAAHEVRATQVNKVMEALRTSSLGELEGVLKSFRGMAAQWATEDGSPPTAFNGVIRMAESVVAERRAQEEVRKSALGYKQSALSQLTNAMGGVLNNIASQEKEIAALSFRALSPSSWLESSISRASGTSAGMEKTLEIDKALLQSMNKVKNEIALIPVPDARASAEILETHVKTISAKMQGVLRVNYDDANKVLANAQAALKTTDAVIREVAEWVPGGSLGIGLAEMRMNPDSPEAQRKFMMGIAMTALDLIPIPGIGQAAGRVAGRLTLSATSRAAPVIVRRAIATGVAAGTKRLVEGGIKAGIQRGAELAADRVLGTEAESKISVADVAQDVGRAAARQAARTAARETVRAILPRRSRRLENLAARWAGRLTNAGIKAAFELNQPDGPRT